MVTKFKSLSWLYDFIAMENGSTQQIAILCHFVSSAQNTKWQKTFSCIYYTI